MLSRKDFLSLVLPPISGAECYYVAEINYTDTNVKIRNKAAYSVDKILEASDEIVTRLENAYFSTASYIDRGNGRKGINIAGKKIFYVDLDAGPTKPYATAKEALEDLKTFCKATGLPKPFLVSSGRGLHVYWVMDEAMSRSTWHKHAEALAALCETHKLKVDRQVTTDLTRILRVPGTVHSKDKADILDVRLIAEGHVVSVARMQELLPVAEDFLSVLDGHTPPREMDAITTYLMGNTQARFKTILEKSSAGAGCAQMLYAYENQATLEEPIWRAALSIAHVCIDREKAIHIMSNKYAGYSPSDTERKAAGTNGPYTCATYRKINPEVCEGCTLNITSPVQLGKEIKEATATENVVTVVEEKTQELVQHTIPSPPKPYIRASNGGIYKKAMSPDEEDELIYMHDLYVVKRMHDPDSGECILVRLHLPMDGSREFIWPLAAVMSKEKFIALAAAQGIALTPRKAEGLMTYLIKWVEELQMKTKTEMSHRQFGWLDDNSAIISGETEIRANSTTYSPPSAPTIPIAPMFTEKGNFHIWKDIINVYGRDGMEDKAFAFFAGFGSMLVKFTDLEGCLLNLYSKDSGSGKTTVLQAINSIWGKPKELLLSPKDTYNARMQRIAVLRNFCVTFDEITNMPPDQMSQMIYDVASGRGKNRLKQHDNAERINQTFWATYMVASSNRSVQDALFSIKQKPEGELMRLLETKIYPDPNDDPAWSNAHFGRLKENYGLGVIPYSQYLIQHLPTILETTFPAIQERIDKQAGIKNTERYWSMMVTVAVLGGILAKRAGLHDIDTGRVAQFGIDLIKRTRIKNREYMFDGDEFLGGFLQRHFNETLVVCSEPPIGSTNPPQPIREPRGALTVRYEPDTRLLFIVAKSYRDDCAKVMVNFEESLAPYKAMGAYKGAVKKRMAANTTATAHAGVSTLCFDAAKLEFFDDKVLTRTETSIYVPPTEYPDFNSVG